MIDGYHFAFGLTKSFNIIFNIFMQSSIYINKIFHKFIIEIEKPEIS